MHMSVRFYCDKLRLRLFGSNARRAWLLLALLFAACTKQEIPDLGPRLPQTAFP